MAYYTVCSICGANLDPGEKCDCESKKAQEYEFLKKHLETEQGSGQFAFVFDSVSNTGYRNIGYEPERGT